MDGAAAYPIGDVRFEHLLDIYNKPDFRRLRTAPTHRHEVEPCRACSFM
jgi:hypothetical protein